MILTRTKLVLRGHKEERPLLTKNANHNSITALAIKGAGEDASKIMMVSMKVE